MSDYRLIIHMSPNFHDNPIAPYFWCILRYEEGLSNSGSGWATTPELAFAAGSNYLNKYILSGEIDKPYPVMVLGDRPKEHITFGVLAPHEEQAWINHMPEYIDRSCAISEAKYEFGRVGAKVIARVPISDVSPVQHGRWVHTEGNLYYCSVCSGYPSYIPTQCRTSKFCPNCGAKMDL